MRSDILLEELPVTDAPGLDTFDPRLSDVMAAIQNSEFTHAADLATVLLQAGEYDIRLPGYLVFCDYIEYGSAALVNGFRAFSSIFGRNWDAFGPIKSKEKHALSGASWLVNNFCRIFEKALKDSPERWSEIVSGLNVDTAHELIEAIGDFNEAFENRLGEISEKNENSRRNLVGIFTRISDIHDADALAHVPAADELKEEGGPEANSDGVETVSKKNNGNGGEVTGSIYLNQLLAKMQAFRDLTEQGRYELAAIIVADIQNTLTSFDPVIYFPNLFAEYNKVIALNVDNIWQHLEMRGTPQWEAYEAYYKADLDGFLKL
jgi:hypothetical protein